MDNVDRTRSAEQSYYENDALWEQDFEQDPDERERFATARAMIPPDVRSLVDIGCGNGAFVNGLTRPFDRVCGVDRSESALKFVRTEKRIASADRLPFEDGEFDLAASMEVIEHLPEGVYQQSLAELARISRGWILVSVPYREDRRLSLVRCPRCYCEFNRNYHLRSFDEHTLRTLFNSIAPDMRLIRGCTVGYLRTHVGLVVARRVMDLCRTRDLPAGSVCPQCCYSHPVRHSGPALSGKKRKTFWPGTHVPRWYVALYERTRDCTGK